MKNASQRKPPGETPIQYRPGPLLVDLLDCFADQWKLSRNESARRLAALAACGLDGRHHDQVEQVREATFGSPDFTEACHQVWVELRAARRVRAELKQPEWTENERQEEIGRIVQCRILLRTQTEDEVEKDHAKVYVRRGG